MRTLTLIVFAAAILGFTRMASAHPLPIPPDDPMYYINPNPEHLVDDVEALPEVPHTHYCLWEESNNCAGLQRVADSANCAPGTPADTEVLCTPAE